MLGAMPRFVVVLPLAPLAEGDGFSMSTWPLHVTVVPTFVTEAAAGTIAAALGPLIEGEPVIEAFAAHDELFGPRENVRVATLAASAPLSRLHERLRSAVLPHGIRFDNPEFTGPGYRPHVTATRRERLAAGDRLSLAQAALVDLAPQSGTGHRVVVAAFALGSGDRRVPTAAR
jgi:2'-5' RNA ligase